LLAFLLALALTLDGSLSADRGDYRSGDDNENDGREDRE
jgi:hypothetical protein